MMYFLEEVLPLMAKKLAVNLSKVGTRTEFLTATRDLEIPATKAAEGTVCGAGLWLTGQCDEDLLLEAEWIYTAQRDHPKMPTIPYDSQYVIEIEGDPSVRTTVDLTPTLEEKWASERGGYAGRDAHHGELRRQSDSRGVCRAAGVLQRPGTLRLEPPQRRIARRAELTEASGDIAGRLEVLGAEHDDLCHRPLDFALRQGESA